MSHDTVTKPKAALRTALLSSISIPMPMASLEDVPDDVLENILSRVPRRYWQCIQEGQSFWGLCLVCKKWLKWVKKQDGKELLDTQPKESLFLICSSYEYSLIAAEGSLSEDRSSLSINLLPHGPSERALHAGAVDLDSYTPIFAHDNLRIDLVLDNDVQHIFSRISYDLQKRAGWVIAEGAPMGSTCVGTGPAPRADLGRGCGLGPHKFLYFWREASNESSDEPLSLQSEHCDELVYLDINELHFAVQREDLVFFRGDCYLLGLEEGACMNRKSGKGDRRVSYIWSTSDGRALPSDLKVEWAGVLVGRH